MPLDRRGQIEVDVPDGLWLLRLATPMSNGTWRTLPDVVAKVLIELGVTSNVELSVLAHLAPGEVFGRAFVDGHPARQVALLHGVEDGYGGVRTVEESLHSVGDRGEFRCSELRAGYYALELRMTSSNQQIAASLQSWRRLSSSQRMDCGTLSVATATCTLALCDTSGTAVTEGLLVLRGDNGVVLVGSPNAEGLITFEQMPVASYDVQLRRGTNAQALARVTLVGDMPVPQRLVVR